MSEGDGGPVFPVLDDNLITSSTGLSIRDWFKGRALVLAHSDYLNGISERELRAMFGDRVGVSREEIIATLTGRYADALIKEGQQQ